MNISKAVITAAARHQRSLPLQTLIDRDGQEKTVLRIILDGVRRAEIDQICVVVAPGDAAAYSQVAGDRAIQFIEQPEPLGYAHALFCARSFTKDEPFLHLVGDHLHIGTDGTSATKTVVQEASVQNCSVSAVQATRETLLRFYGTVGGQRLPGHTGTYRVETVAEKPTPTEAEQRLTISGLRAGHYLCFFGVHVFTPTLMSLVGKRLSDSASGRTSLSACLAELAGREQYLALEQVSRRYDVGVKYGLFRAQLALALSGQDRSEVLAQLLELVALQTTETLEIGQGA